MTTRRTGALLFLATVFLTQSGYNECTGDVLHDPGFDIWCGDELCSWEIEKGDVRKVSTWHDNDPGVDLLGEDAAISQRSENPPVDCLRFQLVADVAEDATVTLEMDLDDDGTVEYERAIPTSRWAELIYLVEIEGHDDIRFRLRKTGPGRAVLAQIRAVDNPECGGDAVTTARPLGADCASIHAMGRGCESGICESATCSECRDAADCAGDVCGLESRVAPRLDPYRTCVEGGSRALGELCAADGECASGECCGGLCSQCCAFFGASCGDGQECVNAASGPPSESWCAPGGGAPGDACRRDEQCASGSCGGGEPMLVCAADGRPCATAADCPTGGEETGACIEVGRAGGSCR